MVVIAKGKLQYYFLSKVRQVRKEPKVLLSVAQGFP